MKKHNIAIVIESPIFSPLSGKLYKQGFNKLTKQDLENLGLNKAVKVLDMLNYTFRGEEYNPNDTVIGIKADKGGFLNRLYGPMIVQSEGKLGIQNHDYFYPIIVNSESEIENSETPEDVTVELSFYKDSSKFENTVASLVWFNHSKDVKTSLMVPIKWKDFKNQPDPDDLNRFLRKGDIDSILQNVGEKGGNGKNFLPTIKLKQLQEENSFTCYGYKEINLTNRKAYVLHLMPKDAQYYESEDGELLEIPPKFSTWANTAIGNILMSNPNINEDNTATLYIKSKVEHKKGVSVDAPLILPDLGDDEDDDLDDLGF